MGTALRDRWAGETRPLRLTAAVLVAVLLWGCGQHVADLALGGVDAYAGWPGWLAGYWTALTVLDPLAAGFLASRHRHGSWLAPAVLLTDGPANLYAATLLPAPGALSVTGPVVVLLLGVVAAAATPRLRAGTVRTWTR